MAKKQTSTTSANAMRGEGLPVPMKVTSREGGRAETHFDLGAAGAPERSFFSDAVFYRSTDQGHRIAFVQREFFGNKPRALVEIFMSHEAALNFKRTLDDIEVANVEAHFDVDITAEPANSIAYSAVFVRLAGNSMAYTGDFYVASPWGLMHGDKHGTSYVEPLVRIHMTKVIFDSFIRYFSAIEGNLA